MDEHEFHRWLTSPYAAGVDQDGVMAMIYEDLDPTQAADDPDAAIYGATGHVARLDR